MVTSCRKEPEIVDLVGSPSIENYNPYTIGNYWVYEVYRIDTNNNEINQHYLDSVWVSGDSLINGISYSVIEGNNKFRDAGNGWGTKSFVRDSMGYLINELGQIQFSLNNYSDTLFTEEFSGIFSVFYKMERLPYTVQVPSGTYSNVLNFKGIVFEYNPPVGFAQTRYLHNYYAPGVGKVLEAFFYVGSTMREEKRLVRFNLN